MAEPVPQILGVTTIRWGVDGVFPLAGCEAGSLDQDNDALIDEKALDANGVVISRILGDAHSLVRVTALYTGATMPVMGTFVTITYDNGGSPVADANYFYNGKNRRRYTNKGNLMIEMELEKHASITA